MLGAMRYLVTGAAGFIGSHLSERLLAEGHDVLGVDCFTDYYDRALKEANIAAIRGRQGFILAQNDLTGGDIRDLVDGSDAIFHLAAQPGVRGSWGRRFDVYIRNNITLTQRLLEVVAEHPIPVVYASSSSVYGSVTEMPLREDGPALPVSPYGVTKLAAEHLANLYCRAYGIPVTSVRYFTVYGPRQRPDMAFTRWCEAVLAGRPLEVLGDGEQSRDFTFVADAVDATIRALRGPAGGVFNVGGGSRATVNEVIGILGELTGERLPVQRKPPVRGDMMHTWADTARAREDLGWEPRTSLRDGLAAQLAWAREALAPA